MWSQLWQPLTFPSSPLHLPYQHHQIKSNCKFYILWYYFDLKGILSNVGFSFCSFQLVLLPWFKFVFLEMGLEKKIKAHASIKVCLFRMSLTTSTGGLLRRLCVREIIERWGCVSKGGLVESLIPFKGHLRQGGERHMVWVQFSFITF